MRINANQTPGVELPTGTAGPSAKTQNGRRPGGDQAQISELAGQLAASDPSRLAQLQAAHAAGTYRVSPSQVANSIINAHMISA